MDFDRQKKLTRYFEGRDAHAYQDSKGFWTLGYGRNIDKRNGPGLRESEMIFMLENDLRETEQHLMMALDFYRDLNAPRQAVLLDMAFNMGVAGLLKFHTMLERLRDKDYRGAATAMTQSKWKTDVGPRRWRPLFVMLSTGEWVGDVLT